MLIKIKKLLKPLKNKECYHRKRDNIFLLTNRIVKFKENNIYLFQITYICAIIVCRKELIFMNKEEQILKLIEDNNGIITTKEISQNDINRVFLTRLVNKGQLERIKNGLYVLPSAWGDEYFNLTYGNNAVFSHETALYFLNLCETVPSTYHITVNRGYNGS